jgi:hypothetical protein
MSFFKFKKKKEEIPQPREDELLVRDGNKVYIIKKKELMVI